MKTRFMQCILGGNSSYKSIADAKRVISAAQLLKLDRGALGLGLWTWGLGLGLDVRGEFVTAHLSHRNSLEPERDAAAEVPLVGVLRITDQVAAPVRIAPVA